MMRIRPTTVLLIALIACGCGEATDSSNAPSPDAIKKANADRAAAIDKDPTISPEGKKSMKEHLGLDKGGPTQDRKK